MQRVTDALNNALQFLSLASKAKSDTERDECVKLARHWMALAVECSEAMSLPEIKADEAGSPLT